MPRFVHKWIDWNGIPRWAVTDTASPPQDGDIVWCVGETPPPQGNGPCAGCELECVVYGRPDCIYLEEKRSDGKAHACR